MSSTIIRKCIEELALSVPRIDYVLGMLEAFEAMATDRTENVIVPILRDSGDNKMLVAGELTAEEQLARQYEKGPVGNI